MTGVVNARDEKRAREAQKRKEAKAAKEKASEWKGFINHDLSKADEENLESMDLETEFPLVEMLEELSRDGYKVTFTPPDRSGTYLVTVMDRSEGSDTCGYALCGRGRSLVDAWYAFAYRHVVVFPNGWEPQPQRETRRFS